MKETDKSADTRREADDYGDIINLPHHTSEKHRHMTNRERAAQFAPFAALTGYDRLIAEAARSGESEETDK